MSSLFDYLRTRERLQKIADSRGKSLGIVRKELRRLNADCAARHLEANQWKLAVLRLGQCHKASMVLGNTAALAVYDAALRGCTADHALAILDDYRPPEKASELSGLVPVVRRPGLYPNHED